MDVNTTITQPQPQSTVATSRPSDGTYRPNLVEGVLEDLETHIALRNAFRTLMGK